MCGHTAITLKAIKQWNELQNFVKTDAFSPEMTYSKLIKSIKSYIEKQYTKYSNYYYNTCSVKLTPHLLLVKLQHRFGIYISPLYHSAVIVYLLIHALFIIYCHCCYYYYYYYYYLFTSFFSPFSLFFLFFSINCFYLFIYFFSFFFFFFIGLAYCVSTAIQVFLLASEFNINI